MKPKGKRVEPRLLVRALFRSSTWVWRVLPASEALRLVLIERQEGERAIFAKVSVLRFELPGDPQSWTDAPRPCRYCKGLATDPAKLTPAELAPAGEAA